MTRPALLPVLALTLNALVWGTSWWPFRRLEDVGLHPLWATVLIYALAVGIIVAVRPRDDPRNPVTGVFSTRSQDRPNPIGLHRVRVVGLDGLRVRVSDLEALDGTPILDIKPVLAGGR